MLKVSYVGDGVLNEFAFDFKFFQPADVRVAVNESLSDPSEYNIAFDENTMRGGTVSFAEPPAEGVRIDIFRRIHLERFIDYQPTAEIDPERLNDDFNFLLEAFRDLNAVELDVAEWKNIHDNVIGMMNTALSQIQYTNKAIADKMGGGAVLGLYNNLLSVLEGALPLLVNDYGSVAEPASNENNDDYGEIM